MPDDGCGELLVQLAGASAVIKRLKRELPRGGPGAGLTVLRTLCQRGELRMGELATLYESDQSVISRHVADLEEHGWVERKQNPDDRRSWFVRLTPEGERMAEEAFELARATFADVLRDWSEEDIAELSRLLARLRRSFDARRDAAAPRHSRPAANLKGL